MLPEKKYGVFVTEMQVGQKFVWAKLSIPMYMLGGEEIHAAVDLRNLVDRWHAAWIRERTGQNLRLRV